MAGSTKVLLQWRRGTSGELGIYNFSPKPNLTREFPGKRIARLVVPLQDGEVIQNLGQEIREIKLSGVLYTRDSNEWDDMETERNNLINGVGIGPGQLHIISTQRHILYNGQITPDGIRFDEQEKADGLHGYEITILVPNVEEVNVPLFNTQIINSDAEISP